MSDWVIVVLGVIGLCALTFMLGYVTGIRDAQDRILKLNPDLPIRLTRRTTP
jgi:hypothetical protein